MVRFGVIGSGAISAAHIDSLKKLEETKLVAVWSRRFENAQRVAAEHGCEAVESYEELVKRDDIDAVTICTPSGFHMEPALAAIEAGKHVIIEKPLEVTVERCNQIIEAADRKGVKLACIFQSRFTPANQELYRAIQEGRFGRLVMGDAYVKWYRSQEYYDSGEWRGTWKLDGGGALMNQAIHTVDVLLWLMGDVESVCAYADCLAHERIEVEDTVVAVLRFKNGAMGVIEAATSVHPGYPKRVEIHGSKGGAVIVDDNVLEWHEADDPERAARIKEEYGVKTTSGTFADPMAMSFDKHRLQLQDFARAIMEDRKPLIDGREGARAVKVVRAIYESAREGKAVSLS